ncbi:hypothetical protein GUITHDRAFT_114797 [Guillardia theta CCMP2712]|uniref:Uncharacterized protein n=1 Tax=Guillardia theta (strain CCMP2712) TaxID=905079 RepID=L1ITB7_GUITC|nr:hypothetical protein GUITHDRAFT_114797 [Guillardia theta CCMP2712]EKX39139.1 hypothetical protein GUITHDRAFT_114797 [Guillardia theta CCMP2712]|eukprot:XP_005826119.1 hypothetical protein GUITHDRAFT_114797 [Guillardia theta CCMP2712]
MNESALKNLSSIDKVPSIDISNIDRNALESHSKEIKVLGSLKMPFRVIGKDVKARSAFSISAQEWKQAERMCSQPKAEPVKNLSEESLKKVLTEKLVGRYVQGCSNISVDHNDPESIVPFLISCMKNIKHIKAHFLAHRKREDRNQRILQEQRDRAASAKHSLDIEDIGKRLDRLREGETSDPESETESVSESVSESIGESVGESVAESLPETESLIDRVSDLKISMEAYEKVKQLILTTYKEETDNLGDEYQSPVFVNWIWVYENIAFKNSNTLGDTSTWIQFIKHIRMNSEDLEAELAGNEIFRIHTNLLKSVGFIGNQEIDIVNSCKILLLMNVMGLTSFIAMERFLVEIFEGNMRNKALQFTSKYADYRFNTEDYDELISSITSCCHLSNDFIHNINIFMTIRENAKFEMRQKILQLHKGRPRLKSLVAKHTDDRIKTVYNMNSFDSWLNYVRFPNTISKRTRFMTYIIMSMPTLNHKEYLEKVLNADMVMNVLKTPITNPDLTTLQKIIEMITYKKQAFEELAKFRMECLGSLSISALAHFSLTKLFQLYLCAYQCKHVWKDCWRHVLPVLSFPMIQNIELFVLNNPINGDEVYSTLYYNGMK